MTSDALVINAVAQVYLDQRCGPDAHVINECSWHSDAHSCLCSKLAREKDRAASWQRCGTYKACRMHRDVLVIAAQAQMQARSCD